MERSKIVIYTLRRCTIGEKGKLQLEYISCLIFMMVSRLDFLRNDFDDAHPHMLIPCLYGLDSTMSLL